MTLKKLKYSSLALLLLAAIPMPVSAQCMPGYQEDAARVHCCQPGANNIPFENSGYCCWAGEAMFSVDTITPCCWNMIDGSLGGRCVNRPESTIHRPITLKVTN